MPQISALPFLRHLRAEPSQHVLRYRSGRLIADGRGLAFWFRPLNAAIAVVPSEVLELPFVFTGVSNDFQEVNVQGVVTYRVTDPARIAERVDFSIDLSSGLHRHKPLERIAGIVAELAQQLAVAHLQSAKLNDLLARGADEVRRRVEEGLRADEGLTEMGLSIVAVRVSAIKPSPELEKALRVPVREKIQQEADEATFRRRAQAVEKERAIQENELQNKIELARREQQFIQQRGENERRRVTDEAEAARITATGLAERSELQAKAEATAIKAVEEAKVGAERDRMLIYREFPADRLFALAAQELAGKLGAINNITITPDHAGELLKQFWGAKAAPITVQASPGR